MKVFKDVFSGDEITSDSYPHKIVDNMMLEFEGKFIVKDTGGDYGISSNAGEEGEEGDGVEGSQQVKVINIVDSGRLVETQFDKKSYITYIKGYMKRLKEKLEETNKARVAGFQSEAQVFVKKILTDFDNYQFYMTESMSDQGMVILSYYKPDDQMTPFFLIWKDGVVEEKM